MLAEGEEVVYLYNYFMYFIYIYTYIYMTTYLIQYEIKGWGGGYNISTPILVLTL